MPEAIRYVAAQSIVLDGMPLQPIEHVPLHDALGRTLARPLKARTALPPFDNAAMDGYAVRREDVASPPTELRLIDTVSAGVMPRRAVASGTCIQITTGAPLPEGSDAVVPVEWTERVDAHTVRFTRPPGGKHNVRRRGEDVQAGDVTCPSGHIVTPPLVGIASGLGHADLPVRVPPHVAVLVTGDELVRPPQRLAPGYVYDVNGPGLAAQIASAGGVPQVVAPIPDDENALRNAIEAALEADVLLVAGGLSVGPDDLVRRVLATMGMTLHFWKVRQRPGKPFAFGRLRGTPVFGLPGNPGAAAMCFEAYVRPTLDHMLGRNRNRLRATALLDAPIHKKKGLHYFVRGHAWTRADGQLCVREAGPQGSAMYQTVLRANCVVHLPEALHAPQPGTPVSLQWLPWAHAAAPRSSTPALPKEADAAS